MRITVMAAATALLLAVPAFAQAAADAPPPAGAESAAPTSLQGPPAEAAPAPAATGLPQRAAAPRTLRAHWHVFVAFALTWLLLFGYALSLGRRFGQLDRDVQRLRRTE